MTFAIINQVAHILEQNQYFACAPSVWEMNVRSKYIEKLIVVDPISKAKKQQLVFVVRTKISKLFPLEVLIYWAEVCFINYFKVHLFWCNDFHSSTV